MSEVSDVVQDFLEMEEDVASLEHYGRMGMKWYQHIYGEEDGRAMYMRKNSDKYVRDKVGRLTKTLKKKATSEQQKAKATLIKLSFLDSARKLQGNDSLIRLIKLT